jgi:Haem-binding domain
MASQAGQNKLLKAVSRLLRTGTFPNFGASYNGMKKILKWILAGLVLVFVLLQFTNPARTNPPFDPAHDLMATNPPPPEIAALMHGACYDCHSDETRWPWYGHIAPVSWLVASDVNDARRHVNFSDWPYDDPRRAARRLGDMSDDVQSGDMPPTDYTWMHPAARLTAAQRAAFVKWADAAAARWRALKTAGTNDVAK